MKNNWCITYEIVTEESASEGDAAERGFELEDVSFREAYDYFTSNAYPLEANCWPISFGIRWIIGQAEQDFKTGEWKTLSFHIPNQITDASRMRLARLMGLKA